MLMTDSLSTSESGTQRERILHVPVSELQPAPHAPTIPPVSDVLASSVKTYGVLQPLLVRPGAEGYEVVAGFKRLQAAKTAGLTDVPVRVYRVEDGALEGLLEASNVRGESRQRIQVPSVNEYKPSGKIGGLLEEELNRSPSEVPYKAIMTVAAVIFLLIWGGINLKKRFPGKADRGIPAATATPEPASGNEGGNGSGIVVPDRGSERPGRVSVAQWQLLLSDVEGIEVRNESNVPRIVFTTPVFSRLTTIDPAQKPRLEQIARIIKQGNSSAVLSIIGHTDNDPIRPSSEYRSNEYLSELRAREVVSFLKGTRIFPESQLRPIAMGAENPPYPNSTPASKSKNRTVSIEIMQPAR